MNSSGVSVEQARSAPRIAVEAGYSPARAHYTLFLLTVISTLNYFDRGIFSAVLQSIKSEMLLSDTAIGLVAGIAFVLFYSVLGVPIAYLADRYSRRNIIAVGLVVWSVMTSLTGMVANVFQLALTRFLMGAGEASSIAPSNAMLSDLYCKERRSFVMGVLATGATFGTSLAFLVGGWMNLHYGWRSAFYVAGIPGVIVALLFVLTVREPSRGAQEKVSRAASGTFADTMRFLSKSKTYIYLLIGFSISGISVYASSVWSAAFVMRVHHLDSGAAGTFLAVGRLMSLPGYIAGGALAERLARIDERWRVWIAALGCALSAPTTLIFLAANSQTIAFVGLCLSSFFSSLHFGPIMATCISVARVRMRAVSAATLMFCGSLVGQIFGPLAIGYFNDRMVDAFGNLAIRYSMSLGALSTLVAGIFICVASRHVVADTRRAS